MGSMTFHAPQVLRRYLLRGRISSRGCLRAIGAQHQDIPVSFHPSIQSCRAQPITTAANHSTSSTVFEDATVPYRKQLKEKAKKRKTANGSASVTKARSGIEHNDRWELTVGIEIHAQLNTAKKLFSTAASTINEAPNTQVALFDLAIPGSQPQFQRETLIPALRAALALNCTIQRKSQFDRKHYFHWDQPAGYQITQYYQPFAREGHITLYAHDGIAKEDGEEVRVGIKQIQMEQDTAKTIAQPGDLHLLDFNRVGVPLIEIITLPDIHYPSTAAALVRKVQAILNTVDACVLGMELGGLRADVNVSVRRRDLVDVNAHHGYAGVSGLGQRTEIKNLSSFKAVRDAIIAERDRQIEVLEAGGIIAGETRGWNLGSTETKRLRGKEGEVDYRYMPDPDLAPVIVGDDLISHLKQSLGMLPDEEMQLLTGQYGLKTKDALSLVALEDGGRVEYFYNVVDELSKLNLDEDCPKKFGRVCGNWVLHELGGVLKDTPSDPNALKIDSEGNCVVPAKEMAQIINHLDSKLITGNTAKNLLLNIFHNTQHGVVKTVVELIEEGSLLLRPMSETEYRELAESVMEPSIVEQILKGQEGKVMHLVGQMMRHGEEGRVEPQEAARIVRVMIEERRT